MSSDQAFRNQVRSDLKKAKRNAEIRSEYGRDLTIDKVHLAIRSLKKGKAAGADGIFLKFLKNCGFKVIRRLSKFFSKFYLRVNYPYTSN